MRVCFFRSGSSYSKSTIYNYNGNMFMAQIYIEVRAIILPQAELVMPHTVVR